MRRSGENERETIRPEFNPAIMIDFQGAKITSDTGFLSLREIDERFGILGPIESELEDTRSWVHSNHTQLQVVRQRVYQIAAGYEDCNDAGFLRIDPALRLASCHRFAANQARLLMGVLAYNLLHMLRQFCLMGEEVKRSMEWLIKRLIKVGAKVSYHGRRWYVHVASACSGDERGRRIG